MNETDDHTYHKMEDIEREEEPWGASQEELIKRWRESSISLATVTSVQPAVVHCSDPRDSSEQEARARHVDTATFAIG